MKVKKIIGIAFLVVGVIGFFISTNSKYDKVIFEETINSPGLNAFEISLEGGQDYIFKFWGEDIEHESNLVELKFISKIQIYNQKEQLLFNQTLEPNILIEWGEYSEKIEGGIEYSHTPKFGESVRLVIDMIEGDHLKIEVFKNLEAEEDAFPGIFIILAVIGLFIFVSNIRKKK